MATARGIWLSYDLGVNGDYESLYAWLDDHDAKECGSSVAFLRYEFDGQLIDSLKNDLSSSVTLNKKSRIYAVYRGEKSTVGKFVIGRRKSAPWEGYGESGEVTEDDGEE